MRNRRLLTLAVLVVALGCAAFAQAQTAVVTVVESGSSFDIRYSISGGVAIGSTASTPGALDFVMKAVEGLDGAVVDAMTVEAPQGTLTDGVDSAAAGFNDTTGIRNVVDASGTNVWSSVLLQPAAYDDPCSPQGQSSLNDAGVLNGVGTTGSAGYALPYNGVSWDGGSVSYDGDTLVLSGTLSATGTGTWNVGVSTYGTDSFSVLPSTGSYVDANGRYTGPLYEDLYDECDPVQAVAVIHTQDAAGLGGGSVAPTTASTLTVETGDIALGADFASNANMTLQVTDGNTSITLTANQTVGGLDLVAANDGYQVVDVAAARLDVVGGDAATIEALVGDSGDGLYSSQVDLANEVLVVADTGGQVTVQATINGDATLDSTVDDSDFFVLINNWKQTADFVTGDWTGDDLCDDSDFFVLINNWKQSFVPTGAAVPEPATMSLLGLGMLGILSRRRRK